jgi:hypothetical protein
VSLYPRITLLMSYHYLRGDVHLAAALKVLGDSGVVDIMVDSGAFSQYMSGKALARQGKKVSDPINVRDYIAWVKENRECIWQHIALDVIKDPPGTRRNLDTMVDAGLRPVLELVPQLVKVNPLVCVAGGADAARAFVQQRIQKVFAVSGGKARIHGLAFVKHPDIYQLPLYSADSSSWMAGGRFGTLSRYSPRDGLVSTPWQKAVRDPAWLRYMVEQCGVPARRVADPEFHRRVCGIGSFVTAYASLRQVEFASRRGVRLMFVCANPNMVKWMAAVLAGAHEDRSRDSFDYMAAREVYLNLQADNSLRSWHAVGDIFKTRTEHDRNEIDTAYRQRLRHIAPSR